MSAGGISYHGIVGYGKATLPSVIGWEQSVNILRDPPKSITVPKRDSVFATSALTEMQDSSGDRACESIKVYARGVNPSVAVSYDNYGNNGGQRSGGFSNGSANRRGQQVRLPYAITDAFRPPAVPLQNLVPLSRQNRIATSAFTQPGFADFSKKAYCAQDDEHTKGVKPQADMLRTCIRPTATYQIETPIVENFEVKYVIKNPTHVTAHSGIRTLDLSEQYVGAPTKQVIANPLHANAHANLGSVRHVDNNEFNSDRYIQDPLHSSVQSNVSQNIQIMSLEDMMDVDIRVKDQFNIEYEAHLKGPEKNEYIHEAPEYKKRLPAHSARTNQSRPEVYVKPVTGYQRDRTMNRPVTQGTTNHRAGHQVLDEISSRKFGLKPTINAGGFEGKATVPSRNRETNVNNHETYQQQINRKVMEMQGGRYSR
jgi:hypothetical protein